MWTQFVLTESTISSPWCSNVPRPSPNFSPRLWDKIWEWPGDEATLFPCSQDKFTAMVGGTYNRARVTYCTAMQSVVWLHLWKELENIFSRILCVSLQQCPTKSNRENASMQHSAHVRVLNDIRESGQTTNEIKCSVGTLHTSAVYIFEEACV